MNPIVHQDLRCEHCNSQLMQHNVRVCGEPLVLVWCEGNKECEKSGKVLVIMPGRVEHNVQTMVITGWVTPGTMADLVQRKRQPMYKPPDYRMYSTGMDDEPRREK